MRHVDRIKLYLPRTGEGRNLSCNRYANKDRPRDYSRSHPSYYSGIWCSRGLMQVHAVECKCVSNVTWGRPICSGLILSARRVLGTIISTLNASKLNREKARTTSIPSAKAIFNLRRRARRCASIHCDNGYFPRTYSHARCPIARLREIPENWKKFNLTKFFVLLRLLFVEKFSSHAKYMIRAWSVTAVASADVRVAAQLQRP